MSDVTPEAPAAPKRRQQQGRSPAYPSVNLQKSVQRVGELYEKERQYAVAATTVPALWGYQNLNGPAGLTLSALKKFGLVDDEGTKDERTVRVTDLAVQLLNHPSSDARAVATKEAALMPPIHREMWEKYGVNLPSDANLLWRLTRERGFTDTGAKEFIREWRETMEFAKLTAEDSSAAHSASVDDKVGISDSVTPVMTRGTESGPETEIETPPVDDAPQGYRFPDVYRQQILDSAVQTYPIPIALSGRPPVTVSGAFPLSEAEWIQFKAVLDAMKPVLVEGPSSQAPSDAQDSRE